MTKPLWVRKHVFHQNSRFCTFLAVFIPEPLRQIPEQSLCWNSNQRFGGPGNARKSTVFCFDSDFLRKNQHWKRQNRKIGLYEQNTINFALIISFPLRCYGNPLSRLKKCGLTDGHLRIHRKSLVFFLLSSFFVCFCCFSSISLLIVSSWVLFFFCKVAVCSGTICTCQSSRVGLTET